MHGVSPFEIPLPGLFLAPYLARVVSVKDPEGLARVQVRLYNCDGVSDQDGPFWARVAVPFAGANRGAFLLPDVDDEVLVSFVNGDPRMPVVIGGLWNGKAKPKESLGGNGDKVDRWTLVGKEGTRIAIVEETQGQAVISLTTPGGVSCTLNEAAGGKVEIKAASTTVTIDSKGVAIQTSAKLQVNASSVEMKAGQITITSAVASFSGIVKCNVLQTPTVVANTYVTGAGNVW